MYVQNVQKKSKFKEKKIKTMSTYLNISSENKVCLSIPLKRVLITEITYMKRIYYKLNVMFL